jgi:predicted nucleotidyltransferase
MISEVEKEIIIRCAKKYRVSELYLFGSSLDQGSGYNDIDLAVRGIEPEVFLSSKGSY